MVRDYESKEDNKKVLGGVGRGVVTQLENTKL